QILDAAARIFASRGFDGASLLQIAGEAGQTQSLIHYYFQSKDVLWQACAQYLFDRMRAFIVGTANAAQDLKPIDRLKLLTRGLIELTIKFPEAGLVLLNETRQAGPRLDWLVENYLRDFQLAIDKLIEEAVEAGDLRIVDTISFSNIIMASVTQVAVCKPLYESIYRTTFSERQLVQKHADQVVAMLFGGVIRTDA
ncbi:TetR family transcriptional regulator, partial [uncultured Brevundimonas sp.]|uniref:TetR/AcrR family transcriptional regulator n=1 Tax=uncultured Brevundimonas sp. TaxID=213418 RepID=UPI0025E6784B